MAAKASFRNFFKPTPRNVARLGNAMLGAATFAAGATAMFDHKMVAAIMFAVGALGKFLTMFFGEDAPPSPPANPE